MQRKTGFHLCSSNHSTILKSDTKGLRWEKYICPLLCLSWSTFISKVLIFILSFEISCVYDMGRRRWQTWLIHPIVWSHYRRNKERKQPGHVYASILSYQGLGPINSQVCSHTHTYPHTHTYTHTHTHTHIHTHNLSTLVPPKPHLNIPLCMRNVMLTERQLFIQNTNR